MFEKTQAECVCGEEIDFEYYASVNVDVDPNLKQKVLNREINLFKCDKCGFQQELAFRFLYHDMKNKIMVLVLPEDEKSQETSEADLQGVIHPVYKELGIEEPTIVTVYGFDGLFELFDKYDIT